MRMKQVKSSSDILGTTTGGQSYKESGGLVYDVIGWIVLIAALFQYGNDEIGKGYLIGAVLFSIGYSILGKLSRISNGLKSVHGEKE